MNITTFEEKMSEEFTKIHLQGLPFNAVLHKFTDIDKGLPHDHPWGFTTFILKGGYIERIYYVNNDGSWCSEDIERPEGTSHFVPATHIHEIIQLLDDECWTLALPNPKEREWGFWDFTDKKAKFIEK